MIDRDSKGKFLPGKAGGPGRPPLSAELPFIEGVKAASSAEKVAEVLDKLYAAAMRNNIRAAELYLSYVIGRPVEKVRLSADSDTVRVVLHWGGQAADDNPTLDTTAQPAIEPRER
ncbi:MAG: hypothetical protein ABI947_05555 [Chloroflexota bacterium]